MQTIRFFSWNVAPSEHFHDLVIDVDGYARHNEHTAPIGRHFVWEEISQ